MTNKAATPDHYAAKEWVTISSTDSQDFEIDFATAVNMFSGMGYEDAVKQARQEYLENHIVAYRDKLAKELP